jgi:hypothetical protein
MILGEATMPVGPTNSKLQLTTQVKISSAIEVSVIGTGYDFAFSATIFE